MEFSSDDKETDRPPSSYPEFAHCFSFFQLFGNYLCLPEVTLLSLEAFFTKGKKELNLNVIFINNSKGNLSLC